MKWQPDVGDPKKNIGRRSFILNGSLEKEDRFPPILPGMFPGPPTWSAIFGNDHPLELELGFGRPHFLFERAASKRAHNLVGIEWKARFVNKANKRIKREKITNLCAIHGNSWHLVGALFQRDTLSRIFLSFPDPWWKKRHRKRRIINDVYVELLVERLAPGGFIFLQTDVASLLEAYLSRLEANPRLVNPYGPFRLCPQNPCGARSHREKKCASEGIPMFRALLQKES